MRMRKKKNSEARLEACADLIISSPEEMESYRDKFPVYLEIGCGKGGFIRDTAKRYPDRTFIAAELQTSAIITALENSKAAELGNVRFINTNALMLGEYFKKGDVKEIYLNFSDPWPKKGHTKRRLTYRAFLNVYKNVLSPDGRIVMKTDNDGLFEFSLEEFTTCGWTLENVTYDLHSEEWAKDNIMTEYEKNFTAQGIKIKSLVARPNPS
ncbi:MAG: tRNA (guanosine(46)-N7)-methyltransferase TrmB [Ruminococcaceae bacterium]|nr:tRNA (guanosine(46)-N7)-methyltransferase TrmB [Oscillospiraceae bacterium]